MAFAEQLAYSDYLQYLRSSNPEFPVSERQPLSKLESILAELSQCDVQIDAELLERKLVHAKARFAWYWAIAELQQCGSFAQRGELQTKFAELSIDLALCATWQRVGRKHSEIKTLLVQHQGRMPGLFLLGLGKLGGRDLNFSSDTDLIGYFDPTVLPVPQTLGASYICHQVLQGLTKLLGQNNSADFIWRLDWRLRPNASAMTLAMSTAAAADYYFYQASPWHRLALMKARVIAGDKSVGEQFLTFIDPFIWRRNLDYRALDELGEIKNKIKREHPSLRSERAWQEPVNNDIVGFNVKLGTGGIREVEFVANALQLVWGGKQVDLRTPNTPEALIQLGARGLLSASAVNDLDGAYRFLRRVENALQLIGNQQTHSIPKSEHFQSALLGLLGLSSWSELVSKLNAHRQQVNAQFSLVFAEQAEASGPPIVWPEGLGQPASEIVDDWERGFIQYGVSRDVRSRLTPLIRGLADALIASREPAATVLRLHDFFRSLPQGEPYFRLLAKSPPLLNCVIPPLMHSPVMSGLLKQSPHIIDCFLHDDRLEMNAISSGESAFNSGFVRETNNYESQLERMRRFVNEQLYQLYLGFLQGHLSPLMLQKSLTELATHTLTLALEVVAQNMGLFEVPVTVIGMGKMGVGRMAPQSDMDLIFVFDPGKYDLAIATKYVARLQTAVSTSMREGVVYELDTRLRPSGRSGASTVSIDSFRKHQLTRARNWEHIALASASVVGGSEDLAGEIDAIKREVLETPRNQKQLIRDAKKMWLRITDHRLCEASPDVFLSKLRVGGLMQVEYLAACQLLVDSNAIPENLDTHFYDRLRVHESTKALLPSIEFWQSLQLWERLLGLKNKRIDRVPAPYVSHMLAHFGCHTTAELAEQQGHNQVKVSSEMACFFDSLEGAWDAPSWHERPVVWR